MSAKAATYLEQLDRARCEGNWGAVPELVRKVRKHAPDRACIALAAETECAVSNATATVASDGKPSNRPAEPNTSAKDLGVSTKLPTLLEAIHKEENFPEDRFQARVCVGWLHWVVAEYSLALVHLPKSLDHQDTQLDPAGAISEWTTVCALKSAYLRANCLMRNYQTKEALVAFHSGLPALARVWSGRSMSKQLSYWSELFLTEYCMLATQAMEENESSLEDPNSVACFRAWARYWEVTSTSLTGGYGFRGSVPRRRMWNQYYIALSRILEDDLPFPTGYLTKNPNDASARAQLRAELQMVESAYQSLLLKETKFPRADEERAEVEAFVKLVVKNWSILCGRGWREQDLGQGGRNALSRGVLDTLYSTATKTFHSTAILRSLFLVHLSVGEFDLAFKSFDAYLELVKKGKARVDKTGHLEPSLDDDGTVLQTMAQAIIALCQYGHHDVAEKARQLGAELEDWLARLPQLTRSGESGAPAAAENGDRGHLHTPVESHIVASSWQAIGFSQAYWARVTHEAASRGEIQARAIRCLRNSLAADFGRSKDIRSYFGLGLLLAERRELTAAIEVVKTALVSTKKHDEKNHLRFGPYWQERSLIPMWHLLALLLSARQDYVMAARACEGALEQFKDPSVLFGKENPNFRSEHLNDAEEGSTKSEPPKGLVDHMDDAEKEAILEVKMTQLALVELLEGPDVAVNASYELLALFSRLFGNVAAQPTLNPPKVLEPPKTSGTLRSIRGSIFGGTRDKARPPSRQPSNASPSEKSGTTPTRPATAKTVTGAAPAIQVTGDGQVPPPRGESTGHIRGNELKPRNSLKKRDRSLSRHRTPSTTFSSQPETVVDGEPFFTPAPVLETEQSDLFTFSSKKQLTSMSSFSRERTLTTLNSYLSSPSKSSDLSELSAETIHVSTDLLPLIQFSKDKERFQRTTILIRVWLMIAGFYRRADMSDDCKGAVTEAQKLVQALEAESNRDPFASGDTKSAGWAEQKSIEDLWGDVHSELGLLSMAKDAPYTARSDFESALIHCPDHPSAIVGLSGILLDIYCEKLRPTPPIRHVHASRSSAAADVPATNGDDDNADQSHIHKANHDATKILPSKPLGLGPTISDPALNPANEDQEETTSPDDDDLPEPYKATRLPLADRLAARDRAYALLSGLTRLGSGWNNSDAWFALARAYEESGQPDKAKEVLWWCVELEESRGVRDWHCLGGGSYVL